MKSIHKFLILIVLTSLIFFSLTTYSHAQEQPSSYYYQAANGYILVFGKYSNGDYLRYVYTNQYISGGLADAGQRHYRPDGEATINSNDPLLSGQGSLGPQAGENIDKTNVNDYLNQLIGTSYNDISNKAQNVTLARSSGQCWVGFSNGWLDVGNCLAQGGYWLLYALSRILALVGTVFSLVFAVTVIGITATITKIDAIKIGWIAFRDLANLTFIFILLFLSIATILRLNGYDAKKLLVKLIIAALLINFSLFFTKVIIDSANILTVTFYNQITLQNGTKLSDPINGGALGDAFMEPFGLQTFAATNDNTTTGSSFWDNIPTVALLKYGLAGKKVGFISFFSGGSGISAAERFAQTPSALTLSIVGAIFILIAIFVFVAACVLFLMRFVLLVILMVLSPLAFAGSILPKTEAMAHKWWSTLISESFFAPMFMLMIWLSLQIAHQVGALSGVGGYKGFSNAVQNVDNIGAVQIVLNFGIIIALLIASLVISKQMGAYGGDAALKVFNGLRNATQGFIGRNTLGEAGRWAEERLAERGWANLPFFDAIRSGTTRAIAGAKFGSGSSRAETYKHNQELSGKREAAGYGNTAKNLLSQLQNKKRPGEVGVTAAEAEQFNKQYGKLEETLAHLSPKELEEVFSRQQLMHDKLLQQAMSTDQREYILEEGEKLSAKEKDHAGKAWASTYEEGMNKIEAIEKEVDDRLATKGLTKEEAEIEKEKELNANQFYNFFRKNLRGFSMKDAELLYKHAPDLLTRSKTIDKDGNEVWDPSKNLAKFLSASLVDDIRHKAQWMGKPAKDLLRAAKFHGLYSATDEADAAFVDLEKAEKEYDDAVKARLDATDGRWLGIRANVATAKNNITLAEKKIKEELKGRNAKELLMLDFKHRNSQFIQKHFGVQEAKTMNSQNRDDIEKLNVAKNLLMAFKNKEMTETQAQLLKYWVDSKDREALSFFSAAARQGVDIPKEALEGGEGNWDLIKESVQEMVRKNKARV